VGRAVSRPPSHARRLCQVQSPRMAEALTVGRVDTTGPVSANISEMKLAGRMESDADPVLVPRALHAAEQGVCRSWNGDSEDWFQGYEWMNEGSEEERDEWR
jgi:hypothetical protein